MNLEHTEVNINIRATSLSPKYTPLGYAYSLPELNFVISVVAQLAHAPYFFCTDQLVHQVATLAQHNVLHLKNKKQKQMQETEQQTTPGDHNKTDGVLMSTQPWIHATSV